MQRTGCGRDGITLIYLRLDLIHVPLSTTRFYEVMHKLLSAFQPFIFCLDMVRKACQPCSSCCDVDSISPAVRQCRVRELLRGVLRTLLNGIQVAISHVETAYIDHVYASWPTMSGGSESSHL
jgi:hypothetical protein